MRRLIIFRNITGLAYVGLIINSEVKWSGIVKFEVLDWLIICSKIKSWVICIVDICLIVWC